MKLAIMQPYLFPYIGYWQLLNGVDCFVVFDDVNYINRGWITMEEYENLCDYLFDPYEKLGGNGSAKKVVDICKTLPIRKVDK